MQTINMAAIRIVNCIDSCNQDFHFTMIDNLVIAFHELYRHDPMVDCHVRFFAERSQQRRVEIIIEDMLSPNESNAA